MAEVRREGRGEVGMRSDTAYAPAIGWTAPLWRDRLARAGACRKIKSEQRFLPPKPVTLNSFQGPSCRKPGARQIATNREARSFDPAFPSRGEMDPETSSG